MTATIRISIIRTGGVSNHAGIFNGQNLQSGWDSHDPTISSLSGQYGSYSSKTCGLSGMQVRSWLAQSVGDEDFKLNECSSISGDL
ncbi:MAG: hypothetical protein K6T83_18535 [Alicyclobacillus sp.]|nr:hypothetical protein [Alicyclobacillus sp.]